MENTIFEVGQVVWCTCFGKGVVTEINLYDKMVKVKHENLKGNLNYYFDGRLFEEGNRMLFFSKPEVIADCEPPYVGKLTGKKIYFTDAAGCARLMDVYEDTKKSFITKTGLTYNKAQIKTLLVLDNVPAYTPD